MNKVEFELAKIASDALKALFQIECSADQLQFTPTKKEFEGDYTLLVFPFTQKAACKPEQLGHAIGQYMQANANLLTSFNVVKGFLNLVVRKNIWLEQLAEIYQDNTFFHLPNNDTKVMVEYSSPNTNKPLHLGHLRNNFLGHALCNILTAAGFDVLPVNLVNDRGIHICKSMIAYQLFGDGITPEKAAKKGDHLVGDFYVAFEKENKKQVEQALAQYVQENPTADAQTLENLKERLKMQTPISKQAQAMLLAWEQNDPEVHALWKTMNQWVLDGFLDTYRRIGVSFDKFYFESETYLLGKEIVEEGLAKGIFFRKEDGSVWVDLSNDGLDEKLVLRADQTSVYITQDMGTADLKFADFPMQKSVYVVGNEQEYHFKVLKLILQKFQRPYADGIFHLSYGMVELPAGKMKSREGTVVDADDLLDQMLQTAQERTEALGKIDDFNDAERNQLYQTLALGALKYYLLRIDPKKKMLFNPEESIDFQGNTGVYIQYNYAKIKAILRKAALLGFDFSPLVWQTEIELSQTEILLIKHLLAYPDNLLLAAHQYSPALIGSYAYELAKLYSRFYSEVPIFQEVMPSVRAFRVALSAQVAQTLAKALALLGIDVPEKM